MLSQKLIFQKSKNFTSDSEILISPTIPINHYTLPRTNKIGNMSYSIIPCCSIQRLVALANQEKRSACFEHSNFLKVNDPIRLWPPSTKRRAPQWERATWCRNGRAKTTAVTRLLRPNLPNTTENWEVSTYRYGRPDLSSPEIRLRAFQLQQI